MSTHVKNVAALDTPRIASKNHFELIVNFAEINIKTHATPQANIVLLGLFFDHKHRTDDGSGIDIVEHQGKFRYCTHLHDLIVHLDQIGGSK